VNERRRARRIIGADGKALEIQSIIFQRIRGYNEPASQWEHGIIVNPGGDDSVIVGMDGRVVLGPVYDWKVYPGLLVTYAGH
jgi:hypothetical protein